jgi:trigger factor
MLSFVGTVDGEAYEGNSVDRYVYEMGRGLMPEEFESALIGVKAGDTVVSEFVIPDTSSNEEFVGKHARFEIEVHEVKSKVLPALDDEFAGNVGGFDTFAEYRDDVRGKLDSAKASAHARQVEAAAVAELAQRLEGEVPDEVVESRAGSMTRDFFQNLEEQKISLQQYLEATGVTADKIQSDIRTQAAERVREELALEALFRANGLEVTEEQVAAAVLELVGGNEAEAGNMRKNLEESGALPIVREQIMHRVALEWLVDNAVVTEKEPEESVVADTPAKNAAPKKAAKKSAKKPAAAAEEE